MTKTYTSNISTITKDQSSSPSSSSSSSSSQILSSSSVIMSPPEHFLCPISLEVMECPVRDKRTGCTFERAAILEWIYFGNATCPLTRKPMVTQNLQRHFELQREIAAWKKQQVAATTKSHDNSPRQDHGATAVVKCAQIQMPVPDLVEAHSDDSESEGGDDHYRRATSTSSTKEAFTTTEEELLYSEFFCPERLTRLDEIRRRVLEQRQERFERHFQSLA